MQAYFNTHFISIQNLFSAYGIKNIAMDDIARSLHISKKTIYKQYSCKDELVNDIYMNDYYRFKARLYSLERENSDAVSKTIQLYNIFLIKILSIKTCVQFDLEKYYPDLLSEITDLYRESINSALIKILLVGKADNYFNHNINANSVAHLFNLLIESYVLNRISKSEVEHILICDDVFDYHFRSICNPIGMRRWEELKARDLVSEQQ